MKISCLISLAAVMLTGCTSDFEKINNPGESASSTDLSIDNYQIGSFLVQLENNAFPEQENAYQMNMDLIGNYLGRYLTYSNNGFTNKNFARFNAPDGWVRYPFSDMTPKVVSAFNEIKRLSTKEDLNYNWALILRTYAMLSLTDKYGPFPMGLNANNPKAYNSQKDIYISLFQDLDTSIKFLEGFVVANQGKKFNAEFDKIYNGDFSKWLKFANSLKLRMAIRIRFAEPEIAKKYGEEAVKSGVMTSNDDNCLITYVPSGLYKTSVEWGDSRACGDIDAYMNGYKDPRIEKYFKPASKAVEDRKIVGCLAGANVGDKKIATALYSAANVEETSRGVWMTLAEVYFCKAEGALAGWTGMGGSVEELYNQGVKASFDQWGAGNADEYLKNTTNKPNSYKDAEGGYGQNMPASSSITIKWSSTDSPEVQMERLITQKWIAMYPNGQEAWNEIRRTGYPKVFDIPTSKNGYTLLVPNRIPFDNEEKVKNPTNYTEAVKLLGGADDYGTKMWWQKK